MADEKDKDEAAVDESSAEEKSDGGEGEEGGRSGHKRMPTAVTMEPAVVQVLRRADDGIGFIEQVAVATFLAVLVLVGTLQAALGMFQNSWFSRLFDFIPAGGTDELIRYMVFFIAMSGAALATQRQRMINMDVLTRIMGQKVRSIVRVIVAVFVIFASLLMVWGSWEVRAGMLSLNYEYEYISPAVGLLAMPVGAGLIALHYLIHAAIELIYLSRGEIVPESDEVKVH